MDKFLLKKYIAIVVSLISCFAIVLGSASMAYNVIVAGQAAIAAPNELNGMASGHGYDEDEDAKEPAPSLPDLNILVLGIDNEANLPDVILVLTYDGVNNAIDIISVPRDVQVVMSPYEMDMLRDAGRWFPEHGVVKLNELFARGGNAVGYRVTSHHIGNLLDIEFDNYVILDLDAFRYIVDAVGGVYMDIRPEGMYYNVNNAVGGTIEVRIPGGRQLLDGNMAEQFVRFRQYRDGDLGRIDANQQFMREFFTQVLAREHILDNAGPLVASFMTHVRTDFGLPNALRYVGALDALNPGSIDFYTMPGQPVDAPNPAGVITSWFFVDHAEARQLVNEIRRGNMIDNQHN
ncbi:MAG: LCP family protein [Clostridiales bacterium]|nr:LCP family protein [Clostridiales bacterium]